MFPPEDDYSSGRSSSSRHGNKRKSKERGRSSRDKSPRASPMEEQYERKPKPRQRQPKGLSASYHVIIRIIYELID